MSNQPQVLEIDPPHEIRFAGPYDVESTSYLVLANPSHKFVGFKVKTTAPNRYYVTPNGGIIEPGGEVEISVMLQPFISEIPDAAKHKFLVQSAFATPTDEDVDKLWERLAKSDFMDSKLRCVFSGEGAEELYRNIGSARIVEELRLGKEHKNNLIQEHESLLQDLKDAKQPIKHIPGNLEELQENPILMKQLITAVSVSAVVGLILGFTVMHLALSGGEE